ncbi:hypothetical protein [Campylobacter sp. 19-13652]|uniref:hypothetical protein n=1 Tax=Campylobacter sp. 19-13652 TaxID=2840180 RepID=UPI001C77A213|nr:hypothetical protein [Campylobacter sp. 19-13652]BCX78759.1 hypothetical protein LBC_02210 [Campylobacter sp. 19-13652]
MKIIPFFLAFLLSGCASFAGLGGDAEPEINQQSSKHCSCSAPTLTKPNATPTSKSSVVKKANEISFCSADGLRLKLRSYDEFDTAVLSISEGEYKALKRAVSASGVLLVGDGVQVHFKSDEGIYSASGKDTPLKKCE